MRTAFDDLTVRLGTVGSTIDECRRRAEQGAPEGTVVIADSQEAGRGTGGHHWHSAPGLGLYLSVLLRPSLRADQVALLRPVAGLAACEAVRRDLGVEAHLKEPNDLVVLRPAAAGGPRKLGGVLVDTSVEGTRLRHAVLSVGLNLAHREADFPAPLRPFATSILLERGVAVDRDEAAAAVLRRLAELRPYLDEVRGRAWPPEVQRRHDVLVRHLPDFRLPELS